MELAIWIVRGATFYAMIGLVFAGAFSVWGVQRLDSAAKGGHPLFRVLIIPGAAALWPLLLMRWIRAVRSGAVAGAHP